MEDRFSYTLGAQFKKVPKKKRQEEMISAIDGSMADALNSAFYKEGCVYKGRFLTHGRNYRPGYYLEQDGGAYVVYNPSEKVWELAVDLYVSIDDADEDDADDAETCLNVMRDRLDLLTASWPEADDDTLSCFDWERTGEPRNCAEYW